VIIMNLFGSKRKLRQGDRSVHKEEWKAWPSSLFPLITEQLCDFISRWFELKLST